MVEHGSLVEYEVTFRHRRNLDMLRLDRLSACDGNRRVVMGVFAQVRSRFVETVAAIACSHGPGRVGELRAVTAGPVERSVVSGHRDDRRVDFRGCGQLKIGRFAGDHDVRRRRRGDDI